MTVALLFKGMALGFAIAAPVGPIGLLCIQRTLHFGRRAGFLSGLGAATADMLCAGMAGFGLTALLYMAGGMGWLMQLVGGGYLIWLGVTMLRSRQRERTEGTEPFSSGKLYASTLLLTLANPMTWMSFAGAFAGSGGAAAEASPVSGAIFMGGVFAGSALWWFLLSSFTDRVRQRLRYGSLIWINRISGAVMAGFGIWGLQALVL